MKKMKIMAMLTAFMITAGAFSVSAYAETVTETNESEITDVSKWYSEDSVYGNILYDIRDELMTVYRNNLDVKFHSLGVGGHYGELEIHWIATDVRYTSTSQEELDEAVAYCEENGLDVSALKLVYIDPILYDIEEELNEMVQNSGIIAEVAISTYNDIGVKITSDFDEELGKVKNYCEENGIDLNNLMFIKRAVFDEETTESCYQLLSNFIEEQNIPFGIEKCNSASTEEYYNGRIVMDYYYPDAEYRRLINKFIEDNSIDADIIGGYSVAEIYESFSPSDSRLERIETLISEYAESENLDVAIEKDSKIKVSYSEENSDYEEKITEFMSENYILGNEVEFVKVASDEKTNSYVDIAIGNNVVSDENGYMIFSDGKEIYTYDRCDFTMFYEVDADTENLQDILDLPEGTTLTKVENEYDEYEVYSVSVETEEDMDNLFEASKAICEEGKINNAYSSMQFSYACINRYDDRIESCAVLHKTKQITYVNYEPKPVFNPRGDINSDNVRDVRDCAILANIIAYGNTVEIELERGDFNGDNVVNIRDAAALAKHLAEK